MAYENLKAAIKQAVKQNGNQEITGNLLQSTLLNIVNTIGQEWQYLGVATTSTVPPSNLEKNAYYFVLVAGTYTNLSNISVSNPGLCIISYNASTKIWTKNIIFETVQTTGTSINQVMSQKAVSSELMKKFNKENIAQELGNDEEKVMSQKVVSSEFYNLSKISLVDNILVNMLINYNGKITSFDNFYTTIAYSLLGVTSIHFEGYVSNTHASYAFYKGDELVKTNDVPQTASLVNIDIKEFPTEADSVRFCFSKIKINDTKILLKTNASLLGNTVANFKNGIDRILNSSFYANSESLKCGNLLDNGEYYAFTAYYYYYNLQLNCNIKTVKVHCTEGTTLKIFRYNSSTLSLIQIGESTAQSDGILTIICDCKLNNEFIAFGTDNGKLLYKENSDNNFKVISKQGIFFKDSTREYSIEFEIEISNGAIPLTLSRVSNKSKLPINSEALKGAIPKNEVHFNENFVMTLSGSLYPRPDYLCSEFISANSYFVESVIKSTGAVYSWIFFDDRFFPLGGYRSDSEETITLNGKLPNIPKNAKYVVLNVPKNPYNKIFAFCNFTSNSRWSGKNVLFLGDSFIDQGYLSGEICRLLGCNEINRGISGAITASKGGNSYLSLVDRIKDNVHDDSNKNEHYHSLPSECDAIIINCSTNDYGTSVELGTMEEGYSKLNTFYGGAHFVINKLVAKYGNIPIIWINATHRFSSKLAEFSISGDGKFIRTRNNANHTLIEYIEALEEVCAAYSVPVVDAYRTSRIQPFFDKNKKEFTVDGLHPNNRGSKQIALKVLEIIEYI